MGEAALRRMTVAEFLEWEPGDDRRYELVGGVPLAMAPPSVVHGFLTARMVRRLAAALDGSGCEVNAGGGVAPDEAEAQVLVPDLVVACGPPRHPALLEPRVIVEVLSPSTEAYDRRTKLPAYRGMASVREVVLLDSRSRFAEVHRRDEDGTSWRVDLLRFPADVVELPSLGVGVPLGPLYEGLELEPLPGIDD